MGSYEYFYPGSSYSLDPKYGSIFTGYRAPAGEIGSPTSIQTANQITEVSNLLNQGIKAVELQAINPEVFDQIPKQHFKEINRLTKLTGSETTIHAPVLDPSGFTKEGWSEQNRSDVEKQFEKVVEKAHELAPKGNIPITIHASAIPGSSWMPDKDKEINEDEYGWKQKQIIAVNQETGQLIPVKREERYYPQDVYKAYQKSAGPKDNISSKDLEKIKGKIREPSEELDIVNNSEWTQNLTQTLFYKNRGDEILEKNYPVIAPVWNDVINAAKEKKEYPLTPTQKAAFDQVRMANEYYENSQLSLNSLYSKAFKYGTDEDKAKLVKLAKQFESEIKKGNPEATSKALQELALGMEDVTPKLYKPVEEFAIDKAAKTFGNLAFHGYDKFGKSAPIISIENLYSGMAFSQSEDIIKLVGKSREQFIKKAKEEGYNVSKETAEKLIGVTWDVGHLNMMKQEGFKNPNVIKESEAIAEFVKHVHLTDNFGYSDSHLPPGMGNVPIKEILQELEKEGFKGKKIVEAGGFFQHFKTSPHPYALEALGSPIYPVMNAPYWNQAIGSTGNYFSFPSAMFPEQHFSLYGSGFSTLPQELGGQVAGKGSRVTGTPME